MKKYIDYGKLLDERHRLGLDEMSRISKINAFNHFIDTMPSADAEEVRHGAWEIVGRTKSNSAILKCSCCQRVRKGHGKSSYCPDCGAKMDIDLNINRAEENCKED